MSAFWRQNTINGVPRTKFQSMDVQETTKHTTGSSLGYVFLATVPVMSNYCNGYSPGSSLVHLEACMCVLGLLPEVAGGTGAKPCLCFLWHPHLPPWWCNGPWELSLLLSLGLRIQGYTDRVDLQWAWTNWQILISKENFLNLQYFLRVLETTIDRQHNPMQS